jgi:hypothetical protein
MQSPERGRQTLMNVAGLERQKDSTHANKEHRAQRNDAALQAVPILVAGLPGHRVSI